MAVVVRVAKAASAVMEVPAARRPVGPWAATAMAVPVDEAATRARPATAVRVLMARWPTPMVVAVAMVATSARRAVAGPVAPRAVAG